MPNRKSFVAGCFAFAFVVGVSLAQAGAQTVVPAVQVARTGTFVIKLTVVAKSGGLSKPYCGAQVYHYGIGNVSNKQVFFSEEASGPATGTASPWICTIKLPYNWPAANDTNPVYVRVHVQSGNSNSVILLARKVTQDFTEVSLPANGKTTTLSKTIHY